MRRLFTYTLALPLLALGVFLTAFTPANARQATLDGTSWTLQQIQRAPGDITDTSASGITLSFGDDNFASGDGSCNSYGAQYALSAPNGLTFSQLISTLRACVDPERNTLEGEYFQAISSVTAYTTDGSTLQLTYNGTSLLKYASSTPTTSPGMPQTGSATPSTLPYALAGLTLTLMGSLLLFKRRSIKS